MKLSESKHLIALLGVLALIISGCASNGSKPEAQQTAQQIEAPKAVASGPDKDLYSQALKAQNAGQFESSIKLWEDFLSKHPDSFEGHNNLGLVYYTQDMLSQALQEFETAYRLEPDDERIRKNLARALRFKAGMIHESRDYFKTLEILARLEKIVEPEEKQAILFKQEQVEDQIFLQVIKANNSASYQDFVNRFPDGLNAVRAREYLEKHPPRVAKSTSRNNVSKSASQGKSWISAGKVNEDPSAAWASAEQPPDYGSSRPTATYTPPPAGAKKKKKGDFFGTDSAAVEESVAPAQEVDPVAAIPFEDFEKPERSSGEQVDAKAPDEGKESLRVASEFSPIRDGSDKGAAGLDTLPDLTPSQVAAVPAEIDAPQSTDTAAGDNIMQPAEPEPAQDATASVEETVEQTTQQEEATLEEPVTESVESESDRIAQILKEEIPQAETAQPEPVQPEPVQEVEAEPQASPEEKTMEEAGISQEAENATSESVESESERIARIVREEIAKEESAEHEQAQPESVQEPDPAVQDGNENHDAAVAIYQQRIKENPKDIEALIGLAAVLSWQKKYQESSVIYQKISEMRPDIPDGELGLLRLKAWQGEHAAAEEGLKALLSKYPERSDIQLLLEQVTAWRMEAEPQASPEEEPMEVASIDPGDQGAKQETIPAESTPVEETPEPDPEEKQTINQETVSETVAALIPSLPQTKAMEAPAESSSIMVVVEMRQGATLNVRAKPSTQGEILGYLENGDMMPFMGESGDWYQIEIEEGLSGWVSKTYSTTRSVAFEASLPVPEDDMTSELSPLESEQQPSSGAMAGAMVLVTVSEDSTLNVRSLPSSSGAVVDMLFGGDKLPLIKEENGWYQVQFEDETTGWISKKFSVLEGGTPVAASEASLSVPVPKKKKAPWGAPAKKDSKEMVTTVVVIKVPEGSSLNVRSSPSSQGQVLGSLKRGDMRPLLEETGEWYQVELQDGQSGWVSQKFSGKMNLDTSFVENP
jgi:uncharacterized protein YgiM (DUF1202 family)/cytochrome c-type biogenesis protein CcmH/NrfG